MHKEKKRSEIFDILKKVMEKDKQVLFAYPFGSYVQESVHFQSDIDLGVYLKPSDIKGYLKKEELSLKIKAGI